MSIATVLKLNNNFKIYRQAHLTPWKEKATHFKNCRQRPGTSNYVLDLAMHYLASALIFIGGSH